MSGKQTGIVWELDLPQPKKIVLLAMADHADQDGNDIYPSIGLIAWKTGYSPRHVQRIINQLEKENLLKLVEKDFGRYHTVNYSLTLENAKRLKKYTGRESLLKDEKMIERGRKAKATREAKDTPVTPDVTPPYDSIVSPSPVTSGCHTNGSTPSVQTGGGDAENASPQDLVRVVYPTISALPSQDDSPLNTRNDDNALNDKPPESEQTKAAKSGILKALAACQCGQGAGISDPRQARKEYRKRVGDAFAAVFRHEGASESDKGAAGKLFDLHFPEARALEFLLHATNGGGERYRTARLKNGDGLNAYHVVNDMDDWRKSGYASFTQKQHTTDDTWDNIPRYKLGD